TSMIHSAYLVSFVMYCFGTNTNILSFPTRRSSDLLNEIDKKVFDYIDLVTDHSSPIDSNFPSVASEVLSALEDVDELVRYGELTPEKGAEHFREEATRILNR